jgi:CheY-like chemotaxis protein
MMNILVIEDDKRVLKTVTEWLQYTFSDMGKEIIVYGASNGTEALEKQNEDIDVVLIDMIISTPDGKLEDVPSLLTKLKSINPHAIYLAMSGYVEHEIIEICKRNGLIEELYIKPVDIDELANILIEKVEKNGRVAAFQ